MFKFFLKVALRNMAGNKSFTFINVAGLTLGLSACVLIALYVRDEFRFDKFIPDNQEVFRVYYKITDKDGASNVATTPPVFASVLQQYPEVNKTTRFLNHASKELFEANGKQIYQGNGIIADTCFFDLFPLQLINGSLINALDDPSSIVISQDVAQKFFGMESPVGKEIKIDKDVFNIRAVFLKASQFHLPVEYIIPLSSVGIPENRLQDWGWYGFYNYFRVNKGTDIALLQKKFETETKPFLEGGTSRFLPLFQPLTKIHLHSSDFKYDMSEKGDIIYVKALSLIAIFILLIACFNFVNLATAKSLQRAKEVGVRKSIGASRMQLIIQYVSETVLLSLICIILSSLLTFLCIPLLNDFTGKQIVFELFTDPAIGISLISLGVLVGVLSGVYPALVLSAFKPIQVLKNNLSDINAGKISWLRHGLVIIQSGIAILLIISTIVVFKQVNYMHNKELGFNQDQIIFFSMKGSKMKKEHEAFKNQLIQIPGVSSVSIGYGFPGDQFGNGDIKTIVNGEEKSIKSNYLMTDHDYIKTLGLQLVSGRDFSKEIDSDKDESYIINETAVKELGFETPQKALGQKLLWNTWAKADSIKAGKVIGVIKDFHYKSLYDKIEPAVMQIYPGAYQKVAIKINVANAKTILGEINTIWKQFSPDYPIEYNFLDDNFRLMYVKDDKLKSMLWIFTSIAIFIGCLGLLGLVAYSAERRKKEIGIRKILGASLHELIILLTREFIFLSLFAFIIASPIAWYLLNKWLQNFAYQVNITWYVFAIAGMISVGVALITVSFQAIKTALANPIKNLRTE